MRISKLFSKTSKTVPADEVAKNAQLLIKAGYIHKETAGIYAYLPLGLKVINNIAEIIRQEMNSVDGQEVMMTILQPKEIWQKTDRWDDTKVDNWFKTELKNGTKLGVGLTHEEPIVDMLKGFVNSHKDLPLLTYQVQTKFRNELRAKSGLLRGREFIMKDAYSFSRDQAQHEEIYNRLVETYYKIYKRLGIGDITYRTYADGGIFTSKFSDEFQTISSIGEDTIYIDEEKNIAINQEIMNDDNLAKLGLSKDNLVEKRAIEVGNTFHLEAKYSDALDMYYNDESGKRQSIIMGCYGIGISRLMGVLAEIFSDDKGLVWPDNVAPYKVYLIRLGDNSITAADEIYNSLVEKNVEVLYDDRDVSAGQKFNDSELIGLPHIVTISDRLISQNQYEYTDRKTGQKIVLTRDELIDKLV